MRMIALLVTGVVGVGVTVTSTLSAPKIDLKLRCATPGSWSLSWIGQSYRKPVAWWWMRQPGPRTLPCIQPRVWIRQARTMVMALALTWTL